MRPANWDIALAEYLEKIRKTPFQWGSNDCITFTNRSTEIITGKGYCDDWIGDYSDGAGAFRHYHRRLSEQGHDGIIAAIDSRLNRLDVKYPPRGTLVGRKSEDKNGVLPIALGIVVSDLAAFLMADGLILLAPDEADLFWSVD